MTYKEVKRIRSNPTAKNVDQKELTRLIDEAIDKQIEAAPRMNPESLIFGFCPRCGSFSNDYGNYCSVCGQKLDWGDEEEDNGEEVK